MYYVTPVSAEAPFHVFSLMSLQLYISWLVTNAQECQYRAKEARCSSNKISIVKTNSILPELL